MAAFLASGIGMCLGLLFAPATVWVMTKFLQRGDQALGLGDSIIANILLSPVLLMFGLPVGIVACLLMRAVEPVGFDARLYYGLAGIVVAGLIVGGLATVRQFSSGEAVLIAFAHAAAYSVPVLGTFGYLVSARTPNG